MACRDEVPCRPCTVLMFADHASRYARSGGAGEDARLRRHRWPWPELTARSPLESRNGDNGSRERKREEDEGRERQGRAIDFARIARSVASDDMTKGITPNGTERRYNQFSGIASHPTGRGRVAAQSASSSRRSVRAAAVAGGVRVHRRCVDPETGVTPPYRAVIFTKLAAVGGGKQPHLVLGNRWQGQPPGRSMPSLRAVSMNRDAAYRGPRHGVEAARDRDASEPTPHRLWRVRSNTWPRQPRSGPAPTGRRRRTGTSVL